MKLYTEEQVKLAMQLATFTDDTYNQVLEKLDLRYGSVKKIVNLISEHNIFFKRKSN